MHEVRRLLALAAPILVGQLAMMSMGLVDVWLVGQVSSAELGALALANAASFSLLVLGLGTAFGVDPMISQAVGAGDEHAVERALTRGFVLLAALSVPLGLAHALIGVGFDVLRQPPELRASAVGYGLAVAPSAPAFILFFLFRLALQARGVVRPVAWMLVAANLLNVLLDLVLIFGAGPVPAMGAVGAGVATTLVRWTLFVALVALAAPERALLARGLAAGVDARRVAAVAREALPVGFQVATEVWAFNLVAPIMGWFGALAVAANAVALNVSALAFQVPLSLSTAAASRVGNLVGEGGDWQRASWVAVRLGAGWGACSAVLLVAFGSELAAAFVPTDPAAAALAATLMPFAATFQIFDATQAVLFGVLRGAGDTRIPSLANLVGYYAIGLPVGVGLATWGGWGPSGVWGGLVLGLAVVAGVLLGRLRHRVVAGPLRVGA